MPMTIRDMLPAMLIVVLPAFLICTGITVLAYRRWRRDHADPE
ncbi:MAG: hypothetical protein ABI305_11090 [Tepidiformaceae bacterium]